MAPIRKDGREYYALFQEVYFGVGDCRRIRNVDAYEDHQNWTIEIVARIAFAGTGDHCPRYRVINTGNRR
jgi:hypothetical protein